MNIDIFPIPFDLAGAEIPEEQFSFTRDQPEIVLKMVNRLERGRAELEVLGNQCCTISI